MKIIRWGKILKLCLASVIGFIMVASFYRLGYIHGAEDAYEQVEEFVMQFFGQQNNSNSDLYIPRVQEI